MPKGLVTVKEYAAFANDVYYKSQGEKLPADWNLFVTCPTEFTIDGYFGATYARVNYPTVDLVIAHRGTDNIEGAFEDIEFWLTNHAPNQFYYGVRPFVEHVMKLLQKEYPVEEYQINWFVTGHSLGGTLAELTIAGNESLQMSGLSFESPGSMKLIEQMESKDLLPKGALNYVRSSGLFGQPIAVSIKTRPDVINTVQTTPNTPIGPVPVPDTYPLNIFNVLPVDPGYFDYIRYSFKVEHPMINILKWINTHNLSELPARLEPWPMGLTEGYDCYKSYADNKEYWDGYINLLWTRDGLLSRLIQGAFDHLAAFQEYYIAHFLYQTGQSEQTKDEQCIEQSEQIEDENYKEKSEQIKDEQYKVKQFFAFLIKQNKTEENQPEFNITPYLSNATNLQQIKANHRSILSKTGFFKEFTLPVESLGHPLLPGSADFSF